MKVSVRVIDKNTLVLENDAKKGDIIDLLEIEKIDRTTIEDAIKSGRDQLYLEKLNEYKKSLDIENKAFLAEEERKHQLVVLELKNELKSQNDKNKADLEIKLTELSKIHQDELNKLSLDKDKEYGEVLEKVRRELEVLKSNEKANLEIKLNEVKNEYINQIEDLKHKLDILSRENDSNLKNKELELDNKYKDIISKKNEDILNQKNKYEFDIEKIKSENELNHIKSINELKEHYQIELRKKDDEINQLQRQKASLNVKQTGEDLEAWCNNTVIEALQNGFECCTWNKDNEVIKDEGESNGSKADYIFRVYATLEHNPNEEITSVCMDMKDENPDSVNKKTNESYYKKLDSNRRKKTCKYAVLVSNLEMDKPNALPMWRVREYDDMYVVRPAYLMTFLNIITSLSKRYQELVLNKVKEELEFKDKTLILEDFDKIKESYLDKQLQLLERDIEDINKNNQVIKNASEKISQSIDHIITAYINRINDKIETFSIRLNRDLKKIDKLD